MSIAYGLYQKRESRADRPSDQAVTRADRAEGSQDTLKQQLADSNAMILLLRIKIGELEKHSSPVKE